METKRTTKALAARIQMDYLNKVGPLLYWRNILIGILCLVVVAWLGIDFFFCGQKSVSPGPVSPAHRLFEHECSLCHTNNFSAVPDTSCLSCHNERIHNKNQTTPPRCASCHTEHTREIILPLSNAGCISCHSNLKLENGKEPKANPHITSFTKDHPDWDYLSKNTNDSTDIKLNHKIHMKPGLEGPEGKKIDMQCSDCHKVDMEKDPAGVYRNAPIDHKEHCMSCHALTFDAFYPDAQAPHKKPEEVKNFIESFYQEKMKTGDMGQTPTRDFAGPKARAVADASPVEGYTQKVDKALAHLFGKKCQLCHSFKWTEGELPTIPKVEMKDSFLDKGTFHHAPHRAMTCTTCHIKNRESEKTEDILIPDIKTCQPCHKAGGSAGESCAVCHKYHSDEPEKVMEGTVKID
ncbi:MAG: hypothetical protein A2048_03995 [Deltaproteobacteria bacterium GWA2_45_12]|nr:MAG: hypothetical protein A2048_03995 [Deltaproteobacteria bacterium GWA2_45_12]